MQARYVSSLDQAYFIYDHLEGEAKEDIRYWSHTDCEDPERILTILQELYGCSKSYVALQENFFSRKQMEDESLQEYSHALFCLIEKVVRNSPGVVINPALSRDLKRLVCQNSDYTLLDVRKEAIRWEQEGEASSRSERSHSLPSFCAVQCFQDREGLESMSDQSDVAELREMLKKQQEQINLLSQNMLQLQNQ